MQKSTSKTLSLILTLELNTTQNSNAILGHLYWHFQNKPKSDREERKARRWKEKEVDIIIIWQSACNTEEWNVIRGSLIVRVTSPLPTPSLFATLTASLSVTLSLSLLLPLSTKFAGHLLCCVGCCLSLVLGATFHCPINRKTVQYNRLA